MKVTITMDDGTVYEGEMVGGSWKEVLPSPVAQGHNPDGLTEEQVGVSEGWRLLSKEEVAGHDVDRRHLQYHIEKKCWADCSYLGTSFMGDTNRTDTYRTKKPGGYFLPKPPLLTDEQINAVRVLFGPGWVAMDEDGCAWAYRARPPVKSGDRWRPNGGFYWSSLSFLDGYATKAGVDWKDSLVEIPAKEGGE